MAVVSISRRNFPIHIWLTSYYQEMYHHGLYLQKLNIANSTPKGQRNIMALRRLRLLLSFLQWLCLYVEPLPANTPESFQLTKAQPQRALCYIKSNYSSSILEKLWLSLFQSMWIEHINITIPESLNQALQQSYLFSNEEVETVVKAGAEKEWKDQLSANTEKVLELGAFGAPWFWVRNEQGKEEPFFGSDRYVSRVWKELKNTDAMTGFISCGIFWEYHSRTWRSFQRVLRKLTCDFWMCLLYVL